MISREGLCREIAGVYKHIDWQLIIDDLEDAWRLTGKQHGMWCTRLVYHDPDSQAFIQKVCVAAQAIDSHLSQFDTSVKRLRWHAPRRAR